MSSSRERAGSFARVLRHPVRAVPVVPRDADFRPPTPPEPRGQRPPPSTVREADEETRRVAYEEGRLAGLAEAQSGAEARRAAALDAVGAELARVARRVSALHHDVLDEVAAELGTLAVDVAEAILGRELALGRTPVRDAVRRALSLVPEGEQVAVRVHPDCGLSDPEIAAISDGHHVRVVRDESVDPAGCSVSAGPCRVDVGVRDALARVRAALDELLGPGSRARARGADGARDGRVTDTADGAAA